MSRGGELTKFINKKIAQLEAQKDTGGGKAMLANLRRGVGKRPGDIPEIWGVFLEEIPEKDTRRTDVSREEWACYIALTLYALHQQGQDKSMHVSEQPLGMALKKLAMKMGDDNAEERVMRRLNSLTQTKDIEAIAYQLRGIIYLLKGEQIGLDYGTMVRDLYLLQFPDAASSVHLNWGRDFYKPNKSENDDNDENDRGGKKNEE